MTACRAVGSSLLCFLGQSYHLSGCESYSKQTVSRISELPCTASCSEARQFGGRFVPRGQTEWLSVSFNMGEKNFSVEEERLWSCLPPALVQAAVLREPVVSVTEGRFMTILLFRATTHMGMPEAASRWFWGWAFSADEIVLVLVHGLQAFVWLDFFLKYYLSLHKTFLTAVFLSLGMWGGGRRKFSKVVVVCLPCKRKGYSCRSFF